MATITNASETLHFPSFDTSSTGGFFAQNISTIGVAFATALLTFIYWEALPKPIPGIPYTQKSQWNPFGDAFDFVKYAQDTGEGFRWFADKSAQLQSPVIQVFLGPFRKPAVIVADTQEIIDISTRRTREFDRGGFLSEWMGVMFPEGTLSMPSHDKFKDLRSTWAATMTSQFLNSVSARTIYHHTYSLLKLWVAKAQMANGRPFEVSDDIKHLTFDMSGADLLPRIWTAATGDDLGLTTSRITAAGQTSTAETAGDPDVAVEFRTPEKLPAIVDASETLVEFLKSMRGSVWLTATRLWVSMLPSWKRAWETKEMVMLQLIDNSRKRFASTAGAEHEATCAMDQVFKRSALAETKGVRLSTRQMIDETFEYIVGGHETTQHTTRWSMKYLTANQNKQAKLREALLELWPGANAQSLPSYQAIVSAEHPYVEATIQELFRMSLTAPSWHRRTTQDVIVLGHRIPRGIDVFGAHSVDSYEEMDDFNISPELRSPTSRPRTGKWERDTKGKFLPERWLDRDGSFDAYAGPMLPFGAGPRGCFGQRLARMELRMIIIILVLSFEFKSIPDAYASFRAEEVINRGPAISYIRPVLRS